MRPARILGRRSLHDGSCQLFDSLIVILEPHNVVLAQIVAQLNFDDGQFDVAAVSQAMISFRWDVDVLALFQAQFPVAANNISHAFDYNPMFAAARMSLQAESRAGFYFQYFDLKAWSFFEDFVAAPWSLVKLSHLGSFLFRQRLSDPSTRID